MKKIININFHSRVVPIEETAYEILQQYIESLRGYFANEEGRDEIISDIENRFAELFSENLKKGATCITDADVNTIIGSMGRPEDFEQEEGAGSPHSGTSANAGSGAFTTGSAEKDPGTGSPGNAGQQSSAHSFSQEGPRRLYRSENDKLLGGVCAGLANYLRLDPAIVRILFALITFGGFGLGFILYIILWIVVPPRSLDANVRKRLYRNGEDRVIAGVASGLAAYFHIDVWIPRLIFALPLILGIITSVFRNIWFDFDAGPAFLTGGFGGSLFITYLVLWIVLPEAVSASEKLEMRGEKVDLESIKNTIRGDIENFKGRAKEMGSEMQEQFSKVGEQMKQSTQSFKSEAAPIFRKTGSGIGHAIGVLFKAFFLFIAGIIAFSLIMVLIGFAFRGDGIITIKSYLLGGFWQNFLAWASFILFLVIPVIALLTWLIRRITGVRSRNHYLGYTFAALWVIGLFSFVALAGMVFNNFRTRQHIEETLQLSQPVQGKLILKTTEDKVIYYDNDNDWLFSSDWERNGPFYYLNEDSLLLRTVRINLFKSEDSDYHVHVIRFSRGNNPTIAKALAEKITFTPRQTDSILYLPKGFAITRDQKFRNQQVLVAVAIPVGKRIIVNKNVERYRWFNVNVNNRHIRWNNHNDDDWSIDSDDDGDWNNSYHWTNNVEYIMTPDGLSRTDKKNTVSGEDKEEDEDKTNNTGKKGPEKKSKDKSSPNNDGYRYHSPAEPAKPKKSTDTAVIKSTAMNRMEDAHLYLLSALFIR
ncbi:PspC domain-containing protein [Flavitalea flava]